MQQFDLVRQVRRQLAGQGLGQLTLGVGEGLHSFAVTQPGAHGDPTAHGLEHRTAAGLVAGVDQP
jgi:hypothetical protein